MATGAILVVSAFAFAAIGVVFSRLVLKGEWTFAYAAALIAAGAITAGLLMLLGAIRRTFNPIHEIRYLLSEAVSTGSTSATRTEHENSKPGLFRLVGELTDRYDALTNASAEYEFANRVLLRERNHLVEALDSLRAGLLVIGSDQKIMFANKASEDFLSLPAGETMGKFVQECIDEPRLLSFMNGQAGDAGGGDKMEMVLEGKTPPPIFTITANAVTDDEGKATARCFLFQDITTGKEVEKANKALIEDIACGFRTRLDSIAACARKLGNGFLADEGAKELCDTIRTETDELERRVDNFLSISRIKSAEGVDRNSTRLENVIDDCIDVLEEKASKKGVQLAVDLPDRLPAFEIDEDLIKTALVNLLENAVKYTPEKGRVSVSTTSTPEEVFIHVSDTGIGIAKDDLPCVFDKFFTSGADADQGAAGDGLGLYTARRIMRLHGGDISVSSRKGKGARFSMSFPRSVLVASGNGARAAAETLDRRKGER
ncbi:MAG: PAS domain-containing protein [Candidatus Abyssubacteria bacterium]|nr:PAS domain-containing protein [Candidatus Abyssubacteria bacterium]